MKQRGGRGEETAQMTHDKREETTHTDEGRRGLLRHSRLQWNRHRNTGETQAATGKRQETAKGSKVQMIQAKNEAFKILQEA